MQFLVSLTKQNLSCAINKWFSVYALKCYQCYGPKGQNNDCEVNLDNINQMNCTIGLYCVSAVITSTSKFLGRFKCNFFAKLMIILGGNDSVIHRLCGASNECEILAAQHHTIHQSTVTCRACNETDLCNSTNRLNSDTHVITFIFSAFVIMFSNFFWSNSS